MTQEVRFRLVNELSRFMKELPRERAKALAHELTVAASSELAGIGRNEKANIHAFPPEMWNQVTVGVPWEAFAYSWGVFKDLGVPSAIRAVCSTPPFLDSVMAAQAAESGLWGGSLLTALGKIFHSAKSELILCSPYWRESGVATLLSAASRPRYDGLDVLIVTQHDGPWMKHDDRVGLDYFVRRMKAMGAKVRVIAPVEVGGRRAFPHAKVVIADSACAYVGSANFTTSGLDQALEAGLIVASPWAGVFARWLKALESPLLP